MFKRIDKAVQGIQSLTTISIIRDDYEPISKRVMIWMTGDFSNKPPGPTMDQLLWTVKVREILTIFRGFKCQNPRDKIYAALPLVLPSTYPPFAPNYGLFVADVYIQVAWSFIQHERCLSILSDRSETSPEMPSRAPDYRYMLDANSMCTRLDTHYRPVYCASGEKELKCSLSTEKLFQKSPPLLTQNEAGVHEPWQKIPSSIWSVLTVPGVALDQIKTLGPLVSDPRSVRRPEWEKLLEGLSKHYAPSNEPTEHSYQRILTADIESSRVFYGDGSFATYPQRVAAVLDGLERDFRRWITQVHTNLPSHSILHMFEDIPGPRRRLDHVWKRGALVDEDFFARSEPSEHPDISLLSNTDKEKELTKRDETRRVKDLIQNTTVNRVFCVTERGYMGLVPYKSKKGDWVVVLFGGHTPFVLRE
jgi:hypothetical protein